MANVVLFPLFQFVLGTAMSYGCKTDAADGIERSISIAMMKNGFAGRSHLKPLLEKDSFSVEHIEGKRLFISRHSHVIVFCKVCRIALV
jgi:hypothetical protein